MKRFSEQFHKQAKGIRMSATERAELRDRLETYMEYHPLPSSMRTATTTKSKKEKSIVSQPFVQLRINTTFLKAFVPTMVLFVVVAVPVLAERTAPGDVLYPVKVRFNEEVRSQLSSSPYEEIEWEARRIERRIAEARLLASEGKLTEEVEAEVAAAVKEQSAKTKEKIALLKSTDADEGAIAEITFASTLSVQNEVLEADQVEQGDVDGSVLATVVAEESEAADAQQAGAQPSYEKLLARLETESTNAQELFDSVKDGAAKEEVKDVERRLADVARKVSAAQALKADADAPVEAVETDTTAAVSAATTSATTSASAEEVVAAVAEIAPEEMTHEAAQLLREALVDVRKLISFMTNIDVRQSVSVDELVPMTLTDDERYNVIQNGLRAAIATQATYEALDDTAAVSEKLLVGIEALSAVIDRVETQVEAGELLAAETQLEELLAIRDDVGKLLRQVEVTSSDGEVETPEEDAVSVESATTTTTNVEQATTSASSTVESE